MTGPVPVTGTAVALPSPVGTPPPAVVARAGTGLIGFIIIALLLLASVGIFFAMRGSLRRLKAREDDPTFGS